MQIKILERHIRKTAKAETLIDSSWIPHSIVAYQTRMEDWEVKDLSAQSQYQLIMRRSYKSWRQILELTLELNSN